MNGVSQCDVLSVKVVCVGWYSGNRLSRRTRVIRIRVMSQMVYPEGIGFGRSCLNSHVSVPIILHGVLDTIKSSPEVVCAD